ncbi:hypothetical protein WN943_019569 [Citrus x changshan-huyou]
MAPTAIATDDAGSQLSDAILLKSTQDDSSSVSNPPSDNNKDSITKESNCHLAADQKKATSTPCKRPRIVLKFSSESKENTDHNVTSGKTLVPANRQESAEGKTWDEKDTTDCHDTRLGLEFVPPPKDKAQEKKIIFSNKFSFSLARDEIEADLLAMAPGFVPPPKEKAQKKKITFSNKLSVSLTRDQIKADLSAMSMCGSSSTKRNNKRSKKRILSVRRQLDHLFPGLHLKFITPRDYKIL